MSTPRTTRGKRVNYAPAHDSDEENHDPQEPLQPEPQTTPAAKRRKSQAHIDDDGEFGGDKPIAKRKRKSGRRSAGRLDGIMKLPVDIFAEVCQYLKPVDLLQLARSSRRLREILVSKDAKNIWRTSRTLIEGLPECPEDMNEPEYATLMFEIGCQEDRADFTEEMWLGVQEDVKLAIEQNQLSIKQRLQATIWLGQTAHVGDDPMEEVVDLNLVTSAFSCRLCNQLLWYDEVMVHTCCVKYRWLDEPSRLKLSGQLFDMEPLVPATREEYALIRRVIRDLGMQRVPTLKEEKELGERCVCLHCEMHSWDGQVELRSLMHVVRHMVIRHDRIVQRVHREESNSHNVTAPEPIVRLFTP
ncbi:hypothetical protein FS837_004890 [Tulasnella sp. UAMH 9824]|nr:hypothetical protein FS837_004890 [Tulasnella sp. UAMH 9824]